MANPFFRPGTERAERVRALFSRIASRYDLINDLQSFGLHRYWKRRLIDLARPQPGQSALDVCCGTGDLALAMAARGLNVVGLDFTEPMLAVARRRAQKAAEEVPVSSFGTTKSGQISAGLTQPPSAIEAKVVGKTGSQIEFRQGDAMQLPFADATFDVVTVGYGLRNLSDWEQGLNEMRRVAKPGGRLLVLDFGKPGNPVWRSVYYAYLKLFVPILGLLFCGNASAYAYILESLKHYPAQQGVAQKMCQLGLIELQVVNFLGGVMSINYGELPSSVHHASLH